MKTVTAALSSVIRQKGQPFLAKSRQNPRLAVTDERMGENYKRFNSCKFRAIDVAAYQQFSPMIRKKANLMPVPELVPDTSMLFVGAGANLEYGYLVSDVHRCCRPARG
jgi:hypothetical protein